MSFSLGALDIPVLRNIVFEFSRKFNDLAVDADICPPCYRRVFIASKREVGCNLNEIFSYEQYQAQLPAITEQLKEVFYSGVLKECRTQSEYINALKVQKQQLADVLTLLEGQQHVAQEQSPFKAHIKVPGKDLITALNEPSNFHAQLQQQAVHPGQASDTALKLDESLKREKLLNIQLQNLQAQAERFTQKINSLLDAQSGLNAVLETEKLSLVKPVLRRLIRLARRVFHLMPGKVQSIIRSVKNRTLPVIKRVIKNSLKSTKVLKQQRAQSLKKILSCEREGYDVFVFPVIDWHFRIQRPQHFASGLAQHGHRVFYFSTTFGDGDPSVTLLEQIEERIFLCQLNIPARHHSSIYEHMPTQAQEGMLIEALDDFIREARIKENVSIVDHPFWTSVALGLSGSMVVYDCMDDHSGFHNTTSEILEAEVHLLQNADLVITSSATLSAKVAKERKNTLIRNAADANWFSQPPENLKYHSDHPVIGYFGAISDWFDLDLVIKAAQAYPEYEFVLIGSTFMCDTTIAESVKNIHFMGEVPYADLKGYLYAFDVCIIPFKLTELILHTNPVKLYEYLASGKPVVATAMPELLLVKEHVHISHNAESFISDIQHALNTRDEPAGIQSRKEFALQNQWSNRVEKFEETIEAICPAVSIVVLTYNNLEFTRNCLDSLLEFTNYPNWELVIVDNASSDGSQEFLRTFAEQQANVKLILNEENAGFAAGNNVGIQNSTGEYIVLLNNDTIVTRGWLWGLIRYFLRDKSLGLLGPVTNNIGNEAKIDIHYDNMDQMAIESRKYTSERSRQLLYINTVAFFCAVIRRQVIDEIGQLDEVFGCGFFEDDDFCVRARNAGFKIAIADDVYIHHHLSASFSLLKEETKKALFEQNKAIYEEKWGAWIPHVYRS